MRRSVKLMMRSGRLGGMEIRMLDEAEWLKHSGWQPEIVFTNFEGSDRFASLAKVRRVQTSQISFPLFMEHWRWRHFGAIGARVRARRLVPRLVSDLAHVPFAWTEQGLSMLWLASRASNRCVVSVHNVFPAWELTEWHNTHLKGAFSRVVGIYGVSDAATAAYTNIFGELLSPKTVIRSVPNFVDCERFIPNESKRHKVRQELGITDDTFVIGVLGRISEQKQPHVVVEALGRLVAECPGRRLKLLFIGGGELEKHVGEYARDANVDDQVHVTGFVETPEVYLAAADVHLLASIREGFGTCTVEAMACGLPVIATDTPASREILQDKESGILVKLGDIDNIVAALRQLLTDDEERRYRASKARAEALNNFSKSIWSERIDTFYAEALQME